MNHTSTPPRPHLRATAGPPATRPRDGAPAHAAELCTSTPPRAHLRATVGSPAAPPWARLALALCALLLSACGALAPPTLQQQRDLFAAQAPSPAQAAQLGHWQRLLGERALAHASFARAPEEPLAALGLSLLALDALDTEAAAQQALRALDLTCAQAQPSLFIAHFAGLLLRHTQWIRGGGPEGPYATPQLLPAEASEEPPCLRALREPLGPAQGTARLSFLPQLALDILHTEGIRPRPLAIEALNERWLLQSEPPAPHAEAVALWQWPLAEGDALIELDASGPLLAWRQASPLPTPPLHRLSAGGLFVSSPGEGPLTVAHNGARPLRAWRWRLPAPEPPPMAPTVPGRAPAPNWAMIALRAEWAMHHGRVEEAQRMLTDLPDAPLRWALLAQLIPASPGLPHGHAQDLARDAWAQAMPGFSARAHLGLTQLALARSAPQEALEHLQQIAQAPHWSPLSAMRARAALSLDRLDLAEQSLQHALQLLPDPCAVLDLQLAVIGARHRAQDDHLAQPLLLRCRRPLRAAERALEAQRPQEALQILDAHPQGDPRDAPAGGAAAQRRRLRVQAQIALGQREAARQTLRDMPDAQSRLLAIDLALADDLARAPHESAPTLTQAFPTQSAGLALITAWPERGLFGSLLLESEAIIRRFEASVPQPGPAIRVLDHATLFFFEGSLSLRRAHEILAIRTREAAETYGEIELPAGAHLVELYTRKADGRILHAEESLEKSAISLRDVSVGDYVVAVWYEPGDNGYLYPRGLRTPRAFFQGVDLPIFFQRFEAFSPDAQPLQVHRLGALPEPEPLRLEAPAPLIELAQALRARSPASTTRAVSPHPHLAHTAADLSSHLAPALARARSPRPHLAHTAADLAPHLARALTRPSERPQLDRSGEAAPPERPSPTEIEAAEAAEEAQPPQAPPGPLAGWRIDVHGVPTQRAEGHSPPAPLWLPSARMGRGVQLAEELAWFRDRLLAQRRSSLHFERWVRAQAGLDEAQRAGQPAPSPRAQLARLSRAVREAVRDEWGLIDSAVTEAVVNGEGNRALVLSAALEVLGIEHTLALARPKVHVPPGPFEGVADFSYPLIFALGEVIDPGPERAELGFFPFPLQGGDWVQLWPSAQAPDTPQPTPEVRTVPDAREIHVRLQWTAEGALRGEVRDVLRGQESIVVGHHLAQLDEPLKQQLVERLLGAAFGAAQITELADLRAQDPDGPLTLRYHFGASAPERLQWGLFPALPGQRYASLAARQSDLLITLPVHQRVVVEIESERPFSWQPPEALWQWAGHSHRLDAQHSADGRRLVVRSELILPGGLISAADYPAFARWARGVDERERLSITR